MNTILQVRKDLCLGCGLCVQNCPEGAINLVWGQAVITHSKCNSCGLCREICPQGAIIETIAVSPQYIREEVQDMKRKTDAILARINRLTQTNTAN